MFDGVWVYIVLTAYTGNQNFIKSNFSLLLPYFLYKLDIHE